jgi:hypothetical protein
VAGNGVGGGDYSFDFFRYFGDVDGDRDVDPVDLFKFKKAYLTDSSSPLYDSRFDSEGDGDVDPVDLFKFKQNYLNTLDAPFQFVVTGTPVTVPEGGTAGFAVALSGAPSAPITVTVARTSGDTDLTVSGGASLVFNSTNWNQPQTVTLAAAEDADTINGTAQFTLTAPNVFSRTVTANEQDNDPSTGIFLVRDDFSGAANAPLDSNLWQVFTNTASEGVQSGSVYQTGDGWAHVAVPAEQCTGTGFFTAQTIPNVGNYHIEGRMTFTPQHNNADNIFILIRSADNSQRCSTNYMNYTGPQIRFNIHLTHQPMQDGFTSVYVTTVNNVGSQYPPTSTSNDISWSGTDTVVLSIDYSADTGLTTFILYSSDKSRILTQLTTTIAAQTLLDIGNSFRVEMGMDGYNSADHYWDYVEVRRVTT